MTPRKTLDDWKPKPAERRLATEMGGGQVVEIGTDLPPDPPPPDRVIRATFLRALILGQIADCPVPETGVRVQGAHIEGDGPEGAETRGLNLEYCDLTQDLGLFSCRLPDMLLLRSVSLRNLYLDEARLENGLSAEKLEATRDMYLHRTVVQGKVMLSRAKLGGYLSCLGAQLTAGEKGDALAADGLVVTNDVILHEVVAQGSVRLTGAKLGGDLYCTGAQLTARDTRDALSAYGLEATGSVYLNKMVARGTVRLDGAKLGGDLSCTGARMTAGETGDALNLRNARIDGVFFQKDGARATGMIDLGGATIGALSDDPSCWPKSGHLILDGLTYRGFVGTATSARKRLAWLALQDPRRFGDAFWPQPYQQLASVYEAQGLSDEAALVRYERAHLQRRAERGTMPVVLRGPSWLWHSIHWALNGYGFRPFRSFWLLILMLFLGWPLYHWAWGQGVFRPTSAVVLRSPEWVLCGMPVGERSYLASVNGIRSGRAVMTDAGQESQLACFLRQPEGRGLPGFDALFFSADSVVPSSILSLQESWTPDEKKSWLGQVARYFLWAQIAAGWVFSFFAFAGFARLRGSGGSD